MRSVVLATCALSALAGGALAVAAPRSGKVVRVERGTLQANATPRVCTLARKGAGSRTAGGFCYGATPEIGERLLAVDKRHCSQRWRSARSVEFGDVLVVE